MSKNLKKLILVLLFLSLTPTFVRFLYYEVKYTSIQNLSSNPIYDLKSVETFPSSKALQLLSGFKNQKIFTFRQADIINSQGNSWIDNFDPRSLPFYATKSDQELFRSLKAANIGYILVPNYTWPTIYNTQFESLLANPRFTTPLISTVSLNSPTSYYQLFKVEERKLTLTCRSKSITESNFATTQEGITTRLLNSLIGIPTGYHSGLEDINLKSLDQIGNLGLNRKNVFRKISSNLNWYDEDFFKVSNRNLIIRVRLNSDSLVSLWVQGISNSSIKRNLFQYGRLVNASEDLSRFGQVEVASNSLLESDIGEIKLFLSSFGGPESISAPLEVEICEIEEDSSREFKDSKVLLGDLESELKIDLNSCDKDGFCPDDFVMGDWWNKLSANFRAFVYRGYKFTERLYGPIDNLRENLSHYFDYDPKELEAKVLRCTMNCPKNGFISISWTNRNGFRTNIPIGFAEIIGNQGIEVYLPKFSGSSRPSIVIRKYSGTNHGSSTFQIWSQDVKKQ